jgi:hypothetical protein
MGWKVHKLCRQRDTIPGGAQALSSRLLPHQIGSSTWSFPNFVIPVSSPVTSLPPARRRERRRPIWRPIPQAHRQHGMLDPDRESILLHQGGAGRARLGLINCESILLHQGVGSWRAATPEIRQQHRASSFLLPASRYWITPHPHSNAASLPMLE